MKLLALDPGPVYGGCVALDTDTLQVLRYWNKNPIKILLEMCKAPIIPYKGKLYTADRLVIETMEARKNQPVGIETFNTCIWIGRFVQQFGPSNTYLIERRRVKLFLTNRVTTKDAGIRQAVISTYPKTGGGHIQEIGTSDMPGPLYGIANHAWQALALGITYIKKPEVATLHGV